MYFTQFKRNSLYQYLISIRPSLTSLPSIVCLIKGINSAHCEKYLPAPLLSHLLILLLLFDLRFSNLFVFYSRLPGVTFPLEFPLSYLLPKNEALLNLFFLPSITTPISIEASLIILPNSTYDSTVAKLAPDDIEPNPIRMKRRCHFIAQQCVWFI